MNLRDQILQEMNASKDQTIQDALLADLRYWLLRQGSRTYNKHGGVSLTGPDGRPSLRLEMYVNRRDLTLFVDTLRGEGFRISSTQNATGTEQWLIQP